MILENSNDLETFKKIYQEQDSILIPISADEHKHPTETDISLLYVQMMGGEEFILPYYHSETIEIDYLGNRPVLKSDTKKYTYDKKKFYMQRKKILHRTKNTYNKKNYIQQKYIYIQQKIFYIQQKKIYI